jgi:hypothetical protein
MEVVELLVAAGADLLVHEEVEVVEESLLVPERDQGYVVHEVGRVAADGQPLVLAASHDGVGDGVGDDRASIWP